MAASGLLLQLRRRAGAAVADGFFTGLSRVGKLHPLANPARHGLEVLRDQSYTDSGRVEHRFDVYRPAERSGPLPALLYVHGGAFRILSKDSHWVFGLGFARRGFVVFSINYRLSPRHPFPAAVQDACAAYRFVAENAARFGADPQRLVIAGESAGANLVSALAVSACFARDEPWARQVYETGVVPRAALPACGVFQVSDQARFQRRRPHKIGAFLNDRLREVEDSYLRPARLDADHHLELADTLSVFASDRPSDRPLPPFFLGVGTADPLLDDSRRLHAALQARGATSELRIYPRQPHAFHALVMLPAARQYWRDQDAFLAQVPGLDLPKR